MWCETIFHRISHVCYHLAIIRSLVSRSFAREFMTHQRRSLLLRPWLLVLLVLALVACDSGGNNDPTPSPEPTATEPLAPGQKSVGELIDGMNAAMGSITSARTVFSTKSTDGTPTTSPVTTEEYIAPDRRRIATSTGSTIVDEQIAIGPAIYMRGSFVTSAVAPMLGTDVWVTVDPALVPSDTPVGNVVAYLTAPFRLPFESVSDSLRGRGVTQGGQVEVAGRTCTTWTFVDTTSFGDKIDYELTIDAQGLPCSLVERAGTIENVTTFEFNVPGLVIVAPDSATPVSGTPEG
jgi:hypothetical protein